MVRLLSLHASVALFLLLAIGFHCPEQTLSSSPSSSSSSSSSSSPDGSDFSKAQEAAGKTGARYFFQGDSITDSCRDRKKRRLDYSLGMSFPYIIAARVGAMYPSHSYFFSNHGVTGETVYDLKKRWHWDTLDLKPDIVTLLVGINDIWKSFDKNVQMNHSEFEKMYESLLLGATYQTGVTVVMCDVFALPGLYTKEKVGPVKWRKEVDKMNTIIHQLALRHHFPHLKLQSVFDDAHSRYNMTV
jgi:lysophospholipase L1-like esterase